MSEAPDVLRGYIRASETARRRVIWLGLACVVGGIISGRWWSDVGWLVGFSGSLLLVIGCYITSVRIQHWKHELGQ